MYIHSSTYLPTFLPIYRFLYIGVLPARVSIVHWCLFGLHVCLLYIGVWPARVSGVCCTEGVRSSETEATDSCL
jgi:hypothetical protein